MTADACATCGHGQDRHYAAEGCIGSFGGSLGDGHFTGCPCTAYLPPRPVPDSRCDDPLCRCRFPKPATVPAPHAEAEAAADAATAEYAKDHPPHPFVLRAFKAGYLRGRGDRG